MIEYPSDRYKVVQKYKILLSVDFSQIKPFVAEVWNSQQ